MEFLDAIWPRSERWRVRAWLLVAPLIFHGYFAASAAFAANADEQRSPATDRGAATSVAYHSPAIVECLRHDASLADVHFVDQTLGWAVGDRGVIWHTDDGGGSWRRQSSGVSCQLNAVFFIDAQRGWAVGGECRPHMSTTRGVVLETENGGRTWMPIQGTILPRLNRVKFFDSEHGVAIGESTPFFPSGVLVTQDGGKTWQPLSTDRAGGWQAGDFLDLENGSVAGPAGRFATVARRKIVHSPLAAASLRSFHAMRLVSPIGGWLVGDGGVVLTTNDLGHSWQTPPGDLLESAATYFDFHAVAALDSNVWVAGSPGTRVFHSSDGGHSWQSFATGQIAPLRAISFVDVDRGWAVGDLGNILATQDGGRTWQTQQSGGKRAALIGIFANATDVPLELFADLGAAEGYIAAIDILHRAADDECDADARTCEAMLLAGAAAANIAWRFPLPPDDLALAPPDVLAALNRANDGRAIEQLERHVVRTLRMWRPDVVVTNHSRLDTDQPMAALAEQLVMKAVAAAADPDWQPELASEAGLAPWQVKKVYGLLAAGSRGDEVLARGRFSPWLGAALGDFVSPARRLIEAMPTSPPDTHELKLLTSHVTEKSGTRGIFSGISLAPGCDARRLQAELPENDIADLRRLAAKRRHLEELLERAEGNAAWAGQVANLTEDLNAGDGAELLVQLADGYRASGRLDLAADTYFLLSRRYPEHPLIEPALAWLVQFYASSETAHYSASGGVVGVRQAAFEDSNQSAPAVGLSRDDRLRRAVQLTEYLKTARPAMYPEPAVRFAEVAAQRQLGFTNPATRYYLTLRQLPESDPWRQCAETEEWLTKPADLPPPKVFGACRPANQPPRLDGRLDEPFWNTAGRLRLRDVMDKATATDAEVRIAYDREFIYFAARCPKIAGGDYRRNDSPRPRDSDLSQHDRIKLRLDIDRDYTTAFELTVDARGWTYDACWGDASWNPNWYVAAADDEATWTIEAAMPLAELVPEPPTARHVWAVAARRTIPRVGYQSWTGNSSVNDSPHQFGLLIFE